MPERQTMEEIETFMHRMTLQLGEDHHKRSPTCQATNTEYVKLPVDTEMVGRAKGGIG